MEYLFQLETLEHASDVWYTALQVEEKYWKGNHLIIKNLIFLKSSAVMDVSENSERSQTLKHPPLCRC